MTQKDKLISKILSGTSDKNIDFNDLTRLLDSLNFSCRVKVKEIITFITRKALMRSLIFNL